jgi:predicted small metal-binding protein
LKDSICGELVPGGWQFLDESADEILRQVVISARGRSGMDGVPPEGDDKLRAAIAEREP